MNIYKESRPVVSAKGIVKDFDGLRAVDGVDLTISSGEIYGFLGPNGAGKTTTVRIIIGLLTPTYGKIDILGYDVLKNSTNVKNHIGYMPQNFSLYKDMTVIENLKFYGGLYGLSDRTLNERIDELLDMVGLDDFRNHIAGNLSGGMKQKLSLVCALVHKPELLIMDEPTAGLDPLTRRILWEYFYEIASNGSAVMVTTHYLDEAEHCNRIGIIHNGKIVAEGTPSKIKEAYFKRNIMCIETDNWRVSFNTLKSKYPDEDIMLFGMDIHLVVDDLNKEEANVKKLIEGSGVKLLRVYSMKPTLEEVFIQLQKELDR
ncbi:MAG: ATP-binding cassette domain-containing protein [bacterium]